LRTKRLPDAEKQSETSKSKKVEKETDTMTEDEMVTHIKYISSVSL